MQDLRITLVQGNTRWHDPVGNRRYYGALLAPLAGVTDVAVLPETFTSGFSNDAIEGVEGMDGPTVAWILEQAVSLGAVVTGSVQLRTSEGVFNRLLWAAPDGTLQTYDKRHLFRYANEQQRYVAGCKRLVVEWKGWRINPQICYDLRFPVFCRNRYDVERVGQLDFDVQLFVANWPAVRADAWRTLLRARAIENLCYVVGVNRVGVDGNQLHYAGDSAVIDVFGQPQLEIHGREQVVTTTMSAQVLVEHRACFPAMLDADAFALERPGVDR
ncbi:amidohydrolase [Xylella taiwanensis]|uniref:Omega-amidase YafV n=1 Tax=Xylella taiwanensis TaxID=1444770 RepID=Z9JJ91_9GAMM|nr:amidohydrolase [Xylella taiwanensis]AXI83190.1 carbon-nitrogen hydrolase [Xylella taiwanensis]EWS77906.1 carbon-nitrogen hydrolase [Xylella taiwanensis]MCD8456241.1 amidohydrolase [Xylella taiwanensis]MCD8458649.1 amidohydrolase [Xylella taiwanensis]MCD8460784.1 amidohydrolase [Xylella taiwanensis]